MILLSDFNRHHPLWDNTNNHHLFNNNNLTAAQPLLDLIARYELDMALPRGIPTLEAQNTKNLTHLDNIFCSTHIKEAIIRCNTEETAHPVNTDYFLIITELDLTLQTISLPTRRNFRSTNWEKFKSTLEEELCSHPDPTDLIHTKEEELH